MAELPAFPASGDPVPTIREDEAGGELAALYADIRRSLGVPLVNLVWRHLATFPGVLAWAWRSVKPLYLLGMLDGEADALRRGLALPSLPAVPAAALRAVGVPDEDEGRVGAILEAYDHTNVLNLLALTALRLHLAGARGDGHPSAAPARHRMHAPFEAPLPKLLTLGEMAPETARLVVLLNCLGGESRILASMYRQLAHWPGFLGLAWAFLAPLDADGRLDHLTSRTLALARRHADGLVGGLADGGTPPSGETRAAVEGTLDEFTATVIARMVPICALLRRAMPEHAPGS